MKLPTLRIGKWTASLPIVQGGMAIRLSLSELAGTVAREGGVGLIAATGLAMDELRAEIRKAREIAPKGIIGINIMVAASAFAEAVHTAIDEKIDVIVAGAGFSRDIFEWGKRGDTPIVPIVSTVKLAKIAEKLGASAVVVEGSEAGGHLGTTRSSRELVPEIKAAVQIPVIGAGGIVNGEDMADMLQLGADGVQVGSRFAATHESAASPAMKEAYVRCTKKDDIVLIQSPVGLLGQAIRNEWAESILNDTVPRPEICTNCLKKCSRRFCLSQSLIRAQEGDGKTGLIFAGTNMLRIHEILPAAQVVRSMCTEAERILTAKSWKSMVPNFTSWTGKVRRVSSGRIGTCWDVVAKTREKLLGSLVAHSADATQHIKSRMEPVAKQASAVTESMENAVQLADRAKSAVHAKVAKVRSKATDVQVRKRAETMLQTMHSVRLQMRDKLADDINGRRPVYGGQLRRIRQTASQMQQWKRRNTSRCMRGRQGVMVCKGV